MTAPHPTPDDGRPSTESRARLAAELHEQLAASRMAWDAALLRSDAALAAGDTAAADAALEDHRALLGVLEERLGAVVAAAVVAREAEDVVRSAAGPAPERPVPHRHGRADRGAEAGQERSPAPGRRLASSLLGAAAAVLLLASVVAGDLQLPSSGSIAGSSSERADAPRAQVASERVAHPTTGFGTGADVAGPRADLPAFSGSLPPAPSRPTTPASDATSEDEGTTRPAEEQAPDQPIGERAPQVPTVDVPTETPVDPHDPDDDRLGELLGRLGRDEAGGGEGGVDDEVDGDVSTSTPRPLTELGERLREPRTAPSASDPAGGLG